MLPFSNQLPLAPLAKLKALLQHLIVQQQTLTYRQAIDYLAFAAPAMQTLTSLLEQLAVEDVTAQRPLRSALIVSQREPFLPNAGFFIHLAELGLPVEGLTQQDKQAWHQAMLLSLFDQNHQS